MLVVNPASGPGSTPHEGYARAVRRRAAWARGCSATCPPRYGTRDPAAVEADIDRYASWYGTDGIFLDEAASGADALPYYRALAAHVRAAGDRMVVLNPGVVPDRRYFGVADVVVTFEGSASAFAARERDPAWLAGVPVDRIALLIYAAAPADADAIRAAAPRAGHVYATPGRLPHPWGTVPDVLAGHATLDGCGSPDRTDSLAALRGRSAAKTRLSHVPARGRPS